MRRHSALLTVIPNPHNRHSGSSRNLWLDAGRYHYVQRKTPPVAGIAADGRRRGNASCLQPAKPGCRRSGNPNAGNIRRHNAGTPPIPRTHRNPGADADAYPDADAGPHANSNAGAHPNRHCGAADSDANAITNPYAAANPNARTNAVANSNAKRQNSRLLRCRPILRKSGGVGYWPVPASGRLAWAWLRAAYR